MAAKLNPIVKLLGSGFYSGYSSKASGTVGSAAAVAVYLIPGFENPSIMIFLISLFLTIGVSVARKFEAVYGMDPKEYTLDEVIGMWITLLFVPKKIWWIVAGFLIFRALDIWKPFPARQLESVKNGWGVLLDDVMAGFYSFIALHLIIYLFNLIIN